MASSRPALTSTSLAREQVLSNGLWEVIVFLINGVLFALLGMQLPQAMSPTLSSDFGSPQLIGIVCAMTALVIGVRFIWVAFLELAHHDPESGKRGTAHIHVGCTSCMLRKTSAGLRFTARVHPVRRQR